MDAKTGKAEHGGRALADQKREAADLVRWFETDGRPFLQSHAPEQLAAFDNDCQRLTKLIETPENITACFLGHSGIGKSTLLNALAAGRHHVLPSGGVGPLTALATEVKHSPMARFVVRYHKRNKLGQLVFALERTYQPSTDDKRKGTANEGPAQELDEDTQKEIESEIDTNGNTDDARPDSQLNSYQKQAQQIVTGDQFGDRTIPYLIDAMRSACGYKIQFDTKFEADDLIRISRVRAALEMAARDVSYERHQGQEGAPFTADLKDHAAGFLAPLVEEIQVGWPSELLRSGITLVDLPGVGIARDSYRQITQKYIRSHARAVVLTVDRAGPTAETVDLLRSSGYWDRLVGAADDPNSDPCKLIIAVTKVDDVASEEWRNTPDTVSPRPKRREIYADLVGQFRVRMKAQITEQLASIGGSSNLALEVARSKARATILANLEIHPVSAPEYRKLLRDDEEEPSFLKLEHETGIPGLRERLQAVAEEERGSLQRSISEVTDRLREGVSGELKRLQLMWRDRARAASITEALEKELEAFLQEKRRERDLRVGMFREFLETTAQSRIRHLVSEARDVAEQEVTQFLRSLRNTHWATLRATVRRGGAFVGTRAINLPEDIASRFQEPMAGVWSTKLLTEVRKRTSEFANDQSKLVDEVCDWANSRAPSNALAEVLEEQKQRIARLTAQMQQVGKEAVADLRETVKARVMNEVRKPIKRACEKFVKDGDDVGRGVKDRILNLFEDLSRMATRAAEAPAIKILEDNFSKVRADIKNAFEDWGDSLQQTADLILQRQKLEIEQKTDQERQSILDLIKSLQEAPCLNTVQSKPTLAHA
jgi:GTP-binding protein EngB required for normal cell division